MKNFTKIAITLAAAGGACYLLRDKLKTTKAYQTVESSETVKKAKASATDTYRRVKNSEPVRKAVDTVSGTCDKIKGSIKDKMDAPDDASREYFVLHEGAADSETSATDAGADDDVIAAKVVTETVAESEGILAKAANAVANAASTDAEDVVGDEYMGLSDVSEDPEVLEEQDKLDV